MGTYLSKLLRDVTFNTKQPDSNLYFENGLVVSDELNSALEQSDKLRLFNYISHYNSLSPLGDLKVLPLSNEPLKEVTPLDPTPKLDIEFNTVAYKIKNYRGYLPISQEDVDDTDNAIEDVVLSMMTDKTIDTENYYIAEQLKKAPQESLSRLEDIKDIINTKMGQKTTDIQVVMSTTLYNEYDQNNLLDNVLGTLSSREVIVLPDEVIGNAVGDKVAFVGDLHAYASFIDRQRDTLRWVDNSLYGINLMLMLRFDVVINDTNAGYYVTLD